MKLISHILDICSKKHIRNTSYYNNTYNNSYDDYQLIEHYNDFSEYLRLIDLCKKTELVTTDKTITFQGDYLFNQNNKKDILKNLKHPQLKYKIKKNNLDIEIYFYKIRIGEYKFRLEIHLNKKKLFYCTYTFANDSNKQHHQDITKIIQNKYINDLSINTYTQSIIDQSQIILNIENTIELKIHYICTNSTVFQTLTKHQTTSANKKVKAIEKHREELATKL